MARGKLRERQIHSHSLQTAHVEGFNELHDPHGRPATYYRILLTTLGAAHAGSCLGTLLV